MPGGRLEPGETHPREAAERETLEEIGVSLEEAEFLGRLDDVDADRYPMVVSCFIYALSDKPAIQADPSEVADVFWFPLSCMVEACRQIQIHPITDDPHRFFPAIKVDGKGQPLWGITYKLLQRLRQYL
jgi:8-oxo-dGTP pyrophosphatase MutT (NUDIX family)